MGAKGRGLGEIRDIVGSTARTLALEGVLR
jgi:hypothetical protein